MTRRLACTVALLVATVAFFLIANRAAYEGYFQDDDLDNLSWTQYADVPDFVKGVLDPRFFLWNFRPTGHFYYFAMGRIAWLDFPPYIAVLHAIHLLNVWLLWMLLRRLGAGMAGAVIGALLFAFHPALFDAYWKPMYIFDVLCGLFALLCLLLYMHGRWVLSFGCFWLAYKSKEIGVMLPAVLLLYEIWLGDKRWKRLIPFFVVSISFGLQGIILNPNKDNDYTLRFTPSSFATTIPYYARKLLLPLYPAFLLLLFPSSWRERRVWFGLAAMLILMFPLSVLPGRLFSVYLYVPILGAALALSFSLPPSGAGAFVCPRGFQPRWLLAGLIVLIWAPLSYAQLREYRRAALTIAGETRNYVHGIIDTKRFYPDARYFLYDGRPAALNRWGIEGALRCIYKGTPAEARPVEEYAGAADPVKDPLTLLIWDYAAKKMAAVSQFGNMPSYLRMDPFTPVWLLLDGWYLRDSHLYRWSKQHAKARLYRPGGARKFELTLLVPPDQIERVQRFELAVALNGRRVGTHTFDRHGWQTVAWDINAAAAGAVDVEFAVTPPFPSKQDKRIFGFAAGGFGFR